MASRSADAAVRYLERVEDGLLVVAVAAMVGLAALQIVLRSAFGGGILWIEPLLQTLVLWTGMLGALVASRAGQHIAIDVLTRSLPPRWRLRVRAAACGFTAAVCVALAWHGGRYVALEHGFAGTAFAQVPTWVVVAIIPAAFGLIGLRYAAFTIAFLRGHEPLGDVPA